MCRMVQGHSQRHRPEANVYVSTDVGLGRTSVVMIVANLSIFAKLWQSLEKLVVGSSIWPGK